jgi:uncharacterized protein YbdZ (MbtH family)
MPDTETLEVVPGNSSALSREEAALRDPQLGVDQIVRAIADGNFGEVLDFPVVNRFTPGLYLREVSVPAGSLVVTKIHKTEHPFVVSKGKISVWTEDKGVVQIEAPYTGITKPGTRRVCFCHTDTVWTTFHPTTETDLEKLEADLICTRKEFAQLRGEQKWLGSQ